LCQLTFIPGVGVSGGRVPLDVRRQRIDTEAQRLVAAGASDLRTLEAPGDYVRVMTDPEGNEFYLN